ncbi:MAG: type II toxin-antitoxin system VapC family toxin [Deltaproteobacteria bacterium]|nr:type II toxin-antitoxin system VapC family toxin [Deltaproteobacteria bacterium]
MREMVVDASVALKWYLPDEEWGDRALRILEMHVAGDMALLAPTILPYEVLNALLVAERRGRTAQGLTEDAFQALVELDIALLNPFSETQEILAMTRPYSRSIYDAAYMAVAWHRKVDLITGDKRLYNAAKGKLKWVRWIGDEA